MDLNAVAVFVKIVESGSFSGAARLLHLPKTTVSARLSALEETLGVRLIQRTTRKLNITEDGQRYFEHCVAAIRELEQGQAELVAARESPTGLLRVTAPVDIGHTLLPRIVHTYVARYPEASVELIITNRTVDLISEGIDLALRAGSLKDSTLTTRRFLEFGANFWASADYIRAVGVPTHPKDLTKLALIGFSNQHVVELVKGKTAFTLPVVSRIRTDDLESMKSLIMLGGYIGWLPDFLTDEEQSNGILVPVLPEWKVKFASEVHFVHASQRYASATLRAFIDTALQFTAAGQVFQRVECNDQ